MKCKYPGYGWCPYFGTYGICSGHGIHRCPGYDDEAERADAHSCSANADAFGYCQVCGAVVYGSLGYYHLYGGE